MKGFLLSPIVGAANLLRGLAYGTWRYFGWVMGGIAAFIVLVAVVGIGLTFERPPVVSIQRGYRGVGMVMHYDPKLIQASLSRNQLPEPDPAVDPSGQPSSEAYQNIQVLKNLDSNEFLRLMSAITTWVSPETGCAYCHSLENMADDALYQKHVARRMIQMVQYINSNWKSHVGAGGVTCYTCHRGQAIPQGVWFTAPPPAYQGVAEVATGQNHPAAIANDSAYPGDPFTPFLLNASTIRVQSTTALPSGDRESIKQADWTYALMMHFAQSLGVSCNYCHNSRAFGEWDQSSPQRVTAWYGIKMVRDLNQQYMVPLRDTFPADQRGSLGDSPKMSCNTCHQGAYKPLYGASSLAAYSELAGPIPSPATPAGGATEQH